MKNVKDIVCLGTLSRSMREAVHKNLQEHLRLQLKLKVWFPITWELKRSVEGSLIGRRFQ